MTSDSGNDSLGTDENTISPKQLRFHHIKSNLFRVIHCDGFMGGPTPQGLFQIAIYSERAPIPQLTVHEVGAAGKLGNELLEERIQRDGVVREIETNLMMTLQTAKHLHAWLKKGIEVAEETLQNLDNETQSVSQGEKTDERT